MTRPLNYLPLGATAEKELIAGLSRGEPACYRHLYDRFAPRLRRIVQRIFSDPQLACDAVQSAFMKAFQKVERFDGRASLLTWLTRIAINEAHTLHHKNSRRPPPLLLVDAPPPPRTPEQEHGDREYHLRLIELLRALPEEKRTALLLFEIEGFSVQEIADITGEPRGTLLARLSRTRAEVEKALRDWAGENEADTGSKKRGAEHG